MGLGISRIRARDLDSLHLQGHGPLRHRADCLFAADHIVLGGGIVEALWNAEISTERGTRAYCDELIRQVGVRVLHVAQQDVHEKIVAWIVSVGRPMRGRELP